MSELSNGVLVQHSTLGLGKVVAVEPTAVHVFFPDSEKRYAAKLRLPMARSMLRTEGLEPNPWLEGLSSFSLDETGRYGLAENWLTHDQAVAEFMVRCPGGFAPAAGDAGGRPSRAARWRAAREGFVELLGGGKGQALQADADITGLTRRLLEVEKLLAPIAGAIEEGALREALADPAAAGVFFEALFGLLSVPVPAKARFDKLFVAVAGLHATPASAWTVATLFPFLADPNRQMVLRPKTARIAADRLGCNLRYDAAPNWATYSALRSFSLKLLERLEPRGAKDLVDVETFMHYIAAPRSASRTAEAEEAAPRRAPARATRKPAAGRARAAGRGA